MRASGLQPTTAVLKSAEEGGADGIVGQAPPAPGPAKTRGLWATIKEYYASAPEKKPDESDPAVVGLRRFEKTDFLGRTKDATIKEIGLLRTLGSKKAVRAYLRLEGAKIMEKIRLRHGTSTIGFHYNMHGGRAEEYVDKGILATRGDRVTNRREDPFHYDTRQKVFFYQTPGENLYDILDSHRMDSWPIPMRMGDTIMLFDLEHASLVEGLAAERSNIIRAALGTCRWLLEVRAFPIRPSHSRQSSLPASRLA